MQETTSGTAEYVILQLALPGRGIRSVGVLLLETATRRLHWMLRTDWDAIAPRDVAEVLAELEEDFEKRAEEIGGEQLLLALEDQLSNVLRLSDRKRVDSPAVNAALRDLFRQFCGPE
jgi:hypothetical protein